MGPYTLIAVQSIKDVQQFNQEDMKLHIHYNEFTDGDLNEKTIRGDWKFKNIDIKKLLTITVKPNQAIKSDDLSVLLKEVSVSPITTRIELDQSQSSNKDFSIIVKDDKGAELELQDTTSSAVSQETPIYNVDFKSTNEKTSYVDIELINNKDTSEKVKTRIQIK